MKIFAIISIPFLFLSGSSPATANSSFVNYVMGSNTINTKSGGKTYTFKSLGSNAECIDGDGEDNFSHGVNYQTKSANDCAKKCVAMQGSRGSQKMVGFDYDSRNEVCDCLFGASGITVQGAKRKSGTTCYKFTGSSSSSSNKRGASVCTYAPDYDCYKKGWPACCDDNGRDTCPKGVGPLMCDVHGKHDTGYTGYCGGSPDYDCYRNGWPQCCKDYRRCPKTQPECEIDDNNFNLRANRS